MQRSQIGHRHGGRLKLHRKATFGEVSNKPPQPLGRTNPPISESGTGGAVSYSFLGVAALFASKPSRGGARNTANRESHALSSAHIANLKAAAAHANRIGLPFTRMVTIHWEAAGVPLSGMATATGRFTDLLAKLVARHGGNTAWLWTHENGPGKGGHCHLLIHVPAALVARLTGLQRGWLHRITGEPYKARVIFSKPVGGRLGLERGNPELHAHNLEAALAYMQKGASPAAAAAFHLDLLQPGGRIIGKRCGTSQNIGAKARAQETR